MKKKLFLILAVLMLFSMPASVLAASKDPGTYEKAANGYAYTAPTVADNSLRVYDFADLLTDDEEAKLTDYIRKVEANRRCSVAVVTTENTETDPDYSTGVTKAYAQDFYDANASGFEDDAWIMCIDMNNRVIYTVGHGRFAAEKYVSFTDKVYDDVHKAASEGNYYNVCRGFAQDVYKLDNWVFAMIPTAASLIISAAVSAVVLLILILIHKKASPSLHADVAVNSLNIQQLGHDSVFLGKHTTVHHIPHDDGGSKGGFSGGGFSGGMSSSGGGGSFSGGGGHF